MLFFCRQNNITIQVRRGVMKKVFLFSFLVVTQMKAAMLVEEAPREINKVILNLIPSFSSLPEIGEALSILAQVNKSFNFCINDSANTLEIIKKISNRFSLSDIETTNALCIRSASERYAIQTAALTKWTAGKSYTHKNLNKLRKVLDLNFTYDQKTLCLPTMLMTTAFWQEYGYSDVGVWLIENGADINVTSQDGRNAFMIASKYFNLALVPLLLNHSKFNVHHKDDAGNTALHSCFGQGITTNYPTGRAIDFEKCKLMCVPLQKLMNMGADPLCKNKEGETPLSLAIATKYEPFVQILTQSSQVKIDQSIGLLTAS